MLLITSLTLGFLSAFAGFLLGSTITSRIWILILIGLSICLLVSFLLSWLVGKSLFRDKRFQIACWLSLGVTVAVFVISIFTIFKPLVHSSEIIEPINPPGIGFWELETGSRIAYQKFPTIEQDSNPPVIFLHGGPGGAVVTFSPIIDVISTLSENGYDVYFYDQIGGGRSGRLRDIKEYALSRHIKDLECIRSKIGASKIILIGESHGGVLAAHYAAHFPENLDKLVLISPGELISGEWDEESSGNIRDRASEATRKKFNRIVWNPRILFSYLLLYINPNAAYGFLSEPEADVFATRMFKLVKGGMACDPNRFPEDFDVLFGFWATVIPDEFPEEVDQNIKHKLKSLSVPTLILKSECDYVKWAVTYEYKALIPNSILLYIEGAGHMPFLEKPNLVFDSIRSFLSNRPLPLPEYDSSMDPRNKKR